MESGGERKTPLNSEVRLNRDRSMLTRRHLTVSLLYKMMSLSHLNYAQRVAVICKKLRWLGLISWNYFKRFTRIQHVYDNHTGKLIIRYVTCWHRRRPFSRFQTHLLLNCFDNVTLIRESVPTFLRPSMAFVRCFRIVLINQWHSFLSSNMIGRFVSHSKNTRYYTPRICGGTRVYDRRALRGCT